MAVLGIGLVLVMSGSVHKRPSPSRHGGGGNQESGELRELRGQGNALFRAGQYLRALVIYQQGYQSAGQRGDWRSAVRFLNNLGSAYYQLFRYRDAVRAYLAAKDLAAKQGNKEMLGALYFNLSSLYEQMGEGEASSQSAQLGLRALGNTETGFRTKLLIQYALVESRKKKQGEAIGLLRNAIEESRTTLDTAAESEAWNDLGDIQIELGQWRAAERALLEAFRLRKFTHDDRLHFSYESLAKLHYLEGDLQSASVLLDRAIESARKLDPGATWSLFYERGKVEWSEGRTEKAFRDFETALQFIRRWRLEVRKRFAEQTFEAAEESRSSSLRALWTGPDLRAKLPPAYWEVLANVQRAEAALMTEDPQVDEASVQPLRLALAEMETRAGIDFPRYPSEEPGRSGLLRGIHRALNVDDVYFGFHVDDQESSLWVVTQDSFEFRPLPGRAELAAIIDHFVNSIRQDSPAAPFLGRELYDQLFGGVDPHLLDKPKWIVAADGPLFDLPFAALVAQFDHVSNAPVYAIERHTIQNVPSASALSPSEELDWTGPFVGLADPIYNQADKRLKSPGSRLPGKGTIAASSQESFALGRLVNGGREIESCARIWQSQGHEPVVLTGRAADKQHLLKSLQGNASVLHMAAHILFPEGVSGPGVVALSLDPGGQPELLGATEIARMRTKLGLVVMNGCSSGNGAVLPGAGLLGMTRAWLAAGARAVIATRWEIADADAAEFFQPFYQQFPTRDGIRHPDMAARALREAQRAALRTRGRHARPAYWATYFCVSRT
jgi:CHAT domain-containing protein/tetratricopeptide (TPR) repeat protein